MLYPCHKCSEVNATRLLYKEHMRTHDVALQVCAVCGKKIMSCTSLYNHLKLHSVLKYSCPHGDYDFSTKSESGFNEHKKYEHLKH